jgi:CRISPR system Cascade subunit CasA
MNLTSDPWIPVVWEDGRAARVSLEDAFRRGHQIRDLAVRPHERIALMRLLICVAQAALDGPKDRAAWRTCAERLPAAAAAYLERWRHAFELFGDGQRFMQVGDIRPVRIAADDEGNSVSKLDLALATGNNSTLFDNAGGAGRAFTPADVALLLLTFQNFSPGGLIGDVSWRGRSMGRSSNHAPCVVRSVAHAYIAGQSLLETVHWNLLTREAIGQRGIEWGRPVWETMPESPQDNGNACHTYVGRLVPLSRTVWLGEASEMVLGNGLGYEGFPGWRETAATVLLRTRAGQEERHTLSLSVAKALWREVPALSVLDRAGREPLGGPLALGNLDGVARCDVWIGGLVADKAKLVDTVEALFHLPAGMFADAGQKRYQEGVQQAERHAGRLGRALSAYHRELKDELDGEFWKHGAKVKQKAASHYWTAVEQHVSDLLAVVEKPDLLHPGGVADPTWSQTAWGKAVFAAARAAYELACPHETPRQMKAYALGLKALFQEPKSDAPVPDVDREDHES